ncbi:MAG: hypothetical protein JWQ29_1214 [Phenylobacterium sp.]|nr:hypothetical protein [Phenylobacterium sp.]
MSKVMPSSFMKSPWTACVGVAAGVAAAVLLVGCAVTAADRALPATNVAATVGEEPALKIAPPRVRLITQSQYANTVAYVFGDDIKVPTRFPAVIRIKGLLALGSSTAVLTPSGVEQFSRNAQLVAEQVVAPARRSYLIPCTPKSEKAADDACAGVFFSKVGRLLYRRPLAPAELKVLVSAAGDASNRLSSFYEGVRYTLTGMLTAPDFLFVVEQAKDAPGEPSGYVLAPQTLATRLSLLLWNAYPDDELIKATDSGALGTPAGLQRQVDRMLASPRLEQGVRAFFVDMLAFDSFDNLAKDPLIYPAYRPQVPGEAAEQALRTIVDHVITRNGDYRDLFTTRRTFLTGSLGALYQIPVDQSKDWTPYEFPEGSPRAGLLTQVGFLSLYAHAGRSSPTKRGRGLRESFLCQTVPDPPPNVDFSIVEDPKAVFHTARERLSAHSTDPTCAGCHKLTDPMGLALENFDGAGQFRGDEKGFKIDASGELDGVAFTDAAGLGRAMRDNPATASCLVSRLYSYGVAREVARDDRPLVRYLGERFANDGYRMPALMRTIALSHAFRAASPPDATPPTKSASLSVRGGPQFQGERP